MLVRKIGQTIVEHFPDCEPVGKSISYNIHGNETAVRLFKRIKYPVRYVDG
jgi:hypothetical protein